MMHILEFSHLIPGFLLPKINFMQFRMGQLSHYALQWIPNGETPFLLKIVLKHRLVSTLCLTVMSHTQNASQIAFATSSMVKRHLIASVCFNWCELFLMHCSAWSIPPRVLLSHIVKVVCQQLLSLADTKNYFSCLTHLHKAWKDSQTPVQISCLHQLRRGQNSRSQATFNHTPDFNSSIRWNVFLPTGVHSNR